MLAGLFETTVQTYCMRPVEVKAIRFTRSNFNEVKEFVNGKAKAMYIDRCPHGKCTCIIETSKGEITVNEGDFVIQDVNGDPYICKADIFFKTYDLVKSDKS